MKRSEAVEKVHAALYPETINNHKDSPAFLMDQKWAEKAVESHVALGLIKFDPEIENPVMMFELTNHKDVGTIKLERWSEGFVLWVGGEIKWRSWEIKNDKYRGLVLEAKSLQSNLDRTSVLHNILHRLISAIEE